MIFVEASDDDDAFEEGEVDEEVIVVKVVEKLPLPHRVSVEKGEVDEEEVHEEVVVVKVVEKLPLPLPHRVSVEGSNVSNALVIIDDDVDDVVVDDVVVVANLKTRVANGVAFVEVDDKEEAMRAKKLIDEEHRVQHRVQHRVLHQPIPVEVRQSVALIVAAVADHHDDVSIEDGLKYYRSDIDLGDLPATEEDRVALEKQRESTKRFADFIHKEATHNAEKEAEKFLNAFFIKQGAVTIKDALALCEAKLATHAEIIKIIKTLEEEQLNLALGYGEALFAYKEAQKLAENFASKNRVIHNKRKIDQATREFADYNKRPMTMVDYKKALSVDSTPRPINPGMFKAPQKSLSS